MLEEFAEILDSARESCPDPLKPRADEAAAQVLGIEKDPERRSLTPAFASWAAR